MRRHHASQPNQGGTDDLDIPAYSTRARRTSMRHIDPRGVHGCSTQYGNSPDGGLRLSRSTS